MMMRVVPSLWWARRLRTSANRVLSGKALAAGFSGLSVLPPTILRFVDIIHDLFQISIRVNELNIAAFGPNLFVLNRVLALPQDTSRVRLKLIANSLDAISNSMVLVARLCHHSKRDVNMIGPRRYSMKLPATMFSMFANDILNRVAVPRIK